MKTMETTQDTQSNTGQESSAPLSLTEAFATNDASPGARDATPEFSFKEETAEQTPADAASTNGDAPAEEAKPAEVTKPEATGEEDGEIPAELAAEYSLDPQNPAHRKALLAIAKLNANNSTGVGTTDVSGELSAFERKHLMPEKPPEATGPPATDSTAAADVKPLEPGKFGDVGDSWKSPVDAYQQIVEEYAKDQPDLMRVHDLETAMFARRLAAIAPALIDARVNAMLKQQLGDLPEQMKATQAKSRSDNNYNLAVKELAKEKGFEDVGKLHEQLSDKKITFEGGQYPDTPLNRIMSEFPDLIDIRVDDKIKDPDIREQLTEVKRLRMAQRLWKQRQAAGRTLAPDKAATIFDAGAQSASKNPADRTRQTLNSGRGASGTGAAGDPNKWLQGGANPDAMSIADLLSTSK